LKSYNCFYSALFNILEPQFHEDTNLLINNRWQFFYNQSGYYTDDKRMIGELPMLYDEVHLEALREKIGIQVSFIKNNNNFIESSIQTGNSKMLFINKMDLMANLTFSSTRRCVTTIIAEKINDRVFHCHTFDKDLDPIQQIDAETLYHSWMFASDYDQLNGCNINIEFPSSHNQSDLHDFIKECMRRSLNSYISPSNTENISYGRDGIKKFSNDILNWDNNDFQKLIDCAMYMDILVKQRMFFISTLNELTMQNKDSIFKDLDTLIESWTRLKMLLFIVGTRKQNGTRQQLSKIISELGELEFNAVSNMMEVLR
jgi:hypothetical protein